MQSQPLPVQMEYWFRRIIPSITRIISSSISRILSCFSLSSCPTLNLVDISPDVTATPASRSVLIQMHFSISHNQFFRQHTSRTTSPAKCPTQSVPPPTTKTSTPTSSTTTRRSLCSKRSMIWSNSSLRSNMAC